MATGDIIRVSDVDVSQITLGVPKALDNGGKMISLFHKGKPLIIQTPNMEVPYGLSKFPGDKGDKLSLDVSFKGNQQSVKDILDLMKAIDAFCVQEAHKNSFAWLKQKSQSLAVMEALYTSVVRYPKDKETGEITDKYPPTMKLNIPTRDGKMRVDVFDINRNTVDIESVNLKGATVASIIRCNGIWVAGGKFGCKFNVLQTQIKESQGGKICGYAFLDDERIMDA